MRIFLSAGEPSGDLHGSNLIRNMLAEQPDCQFSGFGSAKMREAGCDLLRDMSDLAIMGFGRVVPYLAEFWKLYRQANQLFLTQPPAAVVLIDYPGFNWWIARAAKRHNVPVFYFGTPQIWGWATHRVKKLRRLVDFALCKLPFEPDWYRERDCVATYVGHPYFDDFATRQIDHEFMNAFQNKKLVTVLPGSRDHEVTANLLAFLRTIEIVGAELTNIEFAIASYNEKQAAMARELIVQHAGTVRPSVHVNRTRELMSSATVCLACSGSVSLELLHEAKPSVIHYKIDRFGNFLQKQFRRCKFITLVNLLASENRFEYEQSYDPDDYQSLAEAPFPEYLTIDDKSVQMANHVIRWLQDEAARNATVAKLESLREGFAEPGASQRASQFILKQLRPDHHLHEADMLHGPSSEHERSIASVSMTPANKSSSKVA